MPRLIVKKVVLLIFMTWAALNAQFISSLSNPLGRVQSAFPVSTPSLEFIGPVTTTWYGKVGDTTCVSSSVLMGLGLNFTKWLSVSATFPYYYDLKKTPQATYRSPGPGDIRLAIELRKKSGRTSYFAFVPFFTIPAGDLRDVPPDRASTDEDYIGGLFRDYSTTSYDYGAEFLFSTRVKKTLLSLNLGFWNAYQMYFMGKSGNLGYFAGNITFNLGTFNPFVEFYYSKFQDDVFGTAPIFITPGFALKFSKTVSFKGYIDIPLFDRGNVQLLGARIAPDYAGFLSQFPDFTPKMVFNAGLTISPKLMATQGKSRVIIFVKDNKTGEPISGADCYLDEKYEESKNGWADFGLVDRGVYKVKVEHEGYLTEERFIKATGEGNVVVDIPLVKDKFTLIVKVLDVEDNPIESKIIFPEIGAEEYSTGSDGTIEFEIRKDRDTYPAYVWAKGYQGDNILVYTPKNSDTLVYTVRLLKIEGGGIVFPAIYFDLNSSKLKKEYIPFLDQIGKYLLKNTDVKIEIAGYASSDGPEDYNRRLSLRRAEACKNYLIERYKISPERLIVRGYGESNPALPNVGRKREINRRVEFRRVEE